MTPEGYVETLIAEQRGSALLSMDTAARLADLESFFQEMAAHAGPIPLLHDEALTRESFYQDHD